MANRISKEALQKCLEGGLSVTETARQLGVTKGAISKRAKALRITLKGKTSKDVVLFHAGEIVTREINAVDQLHKINSHANELLDLLMRWNRGDNEALQILESQVRKVRVRGTDKELTEYRFKDPRELAFRAMAEIREQLRLQFEMMKALYDMENVAAFQDEVLTAIGEVAPDVRKQIIENLRKRGAIRKVIECP